MATGLPVPVAAHHGDFWPGNVLVHGRGVEVLDFEGCRPGLVFEDPANFLVQSELFLDFPLLRQRFVPFQKAFLRGFGWEDLPSQELYRTCRTSVCLRLLALAQSGPRNPRVFGSSRRIRRLRTLLAKALS